MKGAIEKGRKRLKKVNGVQWRSAKRGKAFWAACQSQKVIVARTNAGGPNVLTFRTDSPSHKDDSIFIRCEILKWLIVFKAFSL